MKLVHVTAVPISLRFVEGMCREFLARGIDVQAISSPGPDLDWAESFMPVHPVPIARAISPLKDLVSIARLVKTFRSMRPDVVVGHMSKAGLLTMIAATIARVPHRVYFNHGMALTRMTGIARAVLYCGERVSCSLAKSVLCVSHSVRRFAIDQGLCAATKIHVPCAGSVDGIDAAGRFVRRAGDREATRGRLGLRDDAFVVGFVGRLVPNKGMPWLLEAWRHFRTRRPDARLLLVGAPDETAPLSPELQSAIENDATIIRTGLVADTRPYFAAMDVFALPSLSEGLSTVLLEASAMELPVITTPVPGCIDVVVDGVTGTVVPERNAVPLADAIERYAQDPTLAARHGRSGRERVLRDFKPEAIRSVLHRHVRELVVEEGERLLDDAAAAAIRVPPG
jgi:glycosyltransferase involved in cell wall biosynthesis